MTTGGTFAELGTRATIDARMQQGAERGGTVTFLRGGSRDVASWARLHEEAQAGAATLQRLGVEPGDRIAFLGSTSRELVTAMQAAWLAGAVVSVLPLPPRLAGARAWGTHLRTLLATLDPALAVVDRGLEGLLGDEPVAIVATGELEATGTGGWQAPGPDPDRLAVLQLTSGSTRDPRAVALSHGAVMANIDAIATPRGPDGPAVADEDDVFVSWLPLYHDLGLFAWLVLPMTLGADTVLVPVEEFRPKAWLEWISELGGTFTGGPNSAYGLVARTLERGADGLDLSSWRVAINGSEAVHPSTLRSFDERAAAHGYEPAASSPSYGLAEATLAVTVSPPRGLVVDEVDRRALEEERLAIPEAGADPVALARLGPPLPGTEVRIVDAAAGAVLDDRELGEVQVRAPSVMVGYYRDPLATAAVMDEGWLRTGDVGYLVDGELVIWGRSKDTIVVGGRNVRPEEVEQAAQVEGVRPGNVIAFGVAGAGGRESVVVVAEAHGSENAASLRGRIASEVRLAVGIAPEDVVLIPRRTLPKTSSGKLQRSVCRDRYLAGDLMEEVQT